MNTGHLALYKVEFCHVRVRWHCVELLPVSLASVQTCQARPFMASTPVVIVDATLTGGVRFLVRSLAPLQWQRWNVSKLKTVM